MTNLSASPTGYPLNAQTTFTAQYLLAGHCAAEFEARATAWVFDGMVYDYGDIWIDVGRYNPDLGRHVENWVEPDQALEAKVLEFLHTGEADDRFRDAAENG
tara:strand:- start:3 stop:308 length:306 start_codon:yes stop_codon:yes gene_type:complete